MCQVFQSSLQKKRPSEILQKPCHDEAKKMWSKDVIKVKSNEVLDGFCQEMKKMFLCLHNQAHKKGQGSSLHVKVFDMLQSESLSGMIPHESSVEGKFLPKNTKKSIHVYVRIYSL